MYEQKSRKKHSAKRLVLCILAVASVVLTLSGCRNQQMNADQANQFIADRLELSQEQSSKISPVTKDYFAEKESLGEIKKSVNDEILSQLKSDTADPEKLTKVLTDSLDQIREKLPKFVDGFTTFHTALTSEQRAEIVEKMKKRREHAEQHGWGRKWGRHWH
ncbi:MAG: hypothetical protein MAG581_00672 [Deltaproteobacteria bacterium]|jgi:Spy/CpxP family protein refolding chaperone|nr:hypothetical protein [Deltaproteobacteria bacterium]